MATRAIRAGNNPAAQHEVLSDLDESIGFLISDTARHSRRVLYARIASHGIRGGTWFVLRVLWQGDGMTQRELATRLGTTQPSTLEMLRTMERDDLVEFRRDEFDRRKLRIHLTEHARRLQVPLMKVANEVNVITLARLSQAEALVMKILLRTVRDTLADDINQLAATSTSEDAPGALDLQDEVNATQVQRTRAARSVKPPAKRPRRSAR